MFNYLTLQCAWQVFLFKTDSIENALLGNIVLKKNYLLVVSFELSLKKSLIK